jgi:hypothetical protein
VHECCKLHECAKAYGPSDSEGACAARSARLWLRNKQPHEVRSLCQLRVSWASREREHVMPSAREVRRILGDDHPWVLHNPRLTAAIMILRRIGYTLLAIFKHVTQRSDHRRHEPWHVLLTRIRHALLMATPATFGGLRRRVALPDFS